MIGCPGLLNAARAGNVTIANAVGNGVADDKLTYTYVPALIEYYLGEKPLLPNVPTFRLDEPDVRSECLGRADQLVFKPVDGSGGHGIVIGPQATDEELAEVTGEGARPTRATGSPRSWCCCPRCRPRSATGCGRGTSTCARSPTNDGERVHVLPGGLTRVALREGSLVVNSSQGGGSKDTWVLTSRPARPAAPDAPLELLPAAVPADAPDPGPASEQQPQQQQQGPPMLSRAAEALFWIGRYAERAEDTARLLDVHFHQIVVDPAVDEAETCRVVADRDGPARPGPGAPSAAVLDLLAFDEDNASSIVGSLCAARENARGVREALSSEIWECLNATHLELPRRVSAAREFGPAPFFSYVRQRAAMLSGLRRVDHQPGRRLRLPRARPQSWSGPT